MEYTKIGTLYDFGIVWDIVRGKDLEYYLIDNNGKFEKFLWKERLFFLSEPWNRIDYFENELGVHYQSIVQDACFIDIFAKDISTLLNIICGMIQVPESLIDKIDSMEEY